MSKVDVRLIAILIPFLMRLKDELWIPAMGGNSYVCVMNYKYSLNE